MGEKSKLEKKEQEELAAGSKNSGNWKSTLAKLQTITMKLLRFVVKILKKIGKMLGNLAKRLYLLVDKKIKNANNQEESDNKMKKVMKQSKMVYMLNAASIILLILTMVSFGIANYAGSKQSAVAEKRNVFIKQSAAFLTAVQGMTNDVRTYVMRRDEAYEKTYLNKVASQAREVSVAAMKAEGINPDDEKLLDKMVELSQLMENWEKQAIEAMKTGVQISAQATVFGDNYQKNIDALEELKTLFLMRIDTNTQTEVDKWNDIYNNCMILLFAFILASIVLVVLVTMLTIKKLVKPVIAIEQEMRLMANGNFYSDFNMHPDSSEIGMLIDSIQRLKIALKTYMGDVGEKLALMAKGDMTAKVELDYIGDFAPMKHSLETIIASLNTILTQIHQASSEVANGSEQVASGAQALAQGATEQASAIEELSVTIGDVGQKVQKNADSAVEAKKMVANVTGEINESNEHMQEMIEAMDSISSTSGEISKIIKTIEEIAFHTNILALNAAVEAARAGAAGKGFAVVADEVRNLASKSSEAAKQTTTLIESSLKAVAEGSKIANVTAKSLFAAVAGIQQVVNSVEEITHASGEQAGAIGQVTLGIEQISAVVQNNSATAEESAAASEELSSQAIMLQQLVGNFRLRGINEAEETAELASYCEGSPANLQNINDDKY